MRTLIAASLVALGIGCVTPEAAQKEAIAKEAIVLIQLRNETVAVHPGGLVSVIAADGTVLAERIDREELRTDYPELDRALARLRDEETLDASANTLPQMRVKP